MTRFPVLLAFASPAWAAPACAEVVAATPAGMTSTNRAAVTAEPGDVWAALTQPDLYWSADHSWSGNSENMTIDPRVGGCFCEALPAAPGGWVEHARVIYYEPDRQLRLSGAFGPLQSEALTGTLTVTLTQVEGGSATEIEWTYVVGGYARFDLVQLAPVVDGVMSEQLGRLAKLLDPIDAPEE